LENRSSFVIIRSFISKYPREFASFFSILIIQSLVSILSVVSLTPLADGLLSSNPDEWTSITTHFVNFLDRFKLAPSIWIFSFIFISSNFLKSILDLFAERYILKLKYNIVGDIFYDTLSKFFNSKWLFFSAKNNSKILNTLNKELVVIADAIGHMGTIFVQLVQLIVFITIPLFINYKMVLITVCLAVFFTLPVIIIRKYSYRLGSINTATNNSMMSIFVENISLSKLIISFSRQQNTIEKFSQVFDAHKAITIKYQFLSRSIPIIFQPFGISAVIIGLVISSSLGGNISEFASVVWSMLRSIPFLGALVQSKVTIDTFLPSYNQLLNLQEEALKYKETRLSGRPFRNIGTGLHIENLDFSYDQNHNILSNLNVKIYSGQTVAITGQSGSGKSTLIDILLGLYEPKSGKISIDGTSYRDYNIGSIREGIGYVPQDPVLFNDTIKNNLLWTNPFASEEDILNACRLSNSLDFINSLPHKFDTIVGERGSNLSGGQRQRLSLARALIKNPQILILDEATSSLDNESENLIKGAIKSLKGKITIILVAHRLTTILDADYIYVISKGTVLEKGTFNDLMLKKGELFKLNNL